MKLKGRLKFISQMIGDCSKYQEIFDTCCDHGYLGSVLSEKFPQTQFILVDINQGIIDRLRAKLNFENLKLLCLDARNIVINSPTSLVIISGVGGELDEKIIREIITKNGRSKKIDFLIVANNKNHVVRKTLMELDYKSFQESLIFENKIGYECIYSKQSTGDAFDLIGKKMFSLPNEDHLNFLKKKHDLYQVKSRYDAKLKPLYDEYKKLLL